MPSRLEAVRPLLPEEVAEVSPTVWIEADVVLTHMVAAEGPLGDSLEALQGGPEEAQEDPGEDLAVPQEVPEPPVSRRAAPDRRTES